MNSYIYLIQDGKFINTNIYKIGRTTQKGDTRRLIRFSSYNKETIQKFLREVNNELVINIEDEIKTLFTQKYKLVQGSEWFEGDCNSMILEINSVIDKSKSLICVPINNKIKKDNTGIEKKIELEIEKLKLELELKYKLEIKDLELKNKDLQHKIEIEDLKLKYLEENNNLKINITNINNSNNNINHNIRHKPINISKSKLDNLNMNYSLMIDMNTFITNFESEKYGLSETDAEKLLDVCKNGYIEEIIDQFFNYLKDSMRKQCENNNIILVNDKVVLPFVFGDPYSIYHFEKLTEKEWYQIKFYEKIEKIVSIIEKQVYYHTNEHLYLNDYKKRRIMKGMLKKSTID